jgi:hypothetical protein
MGGTVCLGKGRIGRLWSAREDSPHHGDQAEMFARGEMKRVAFTERDVEAQTTRRYRPGAVTP